MSGICLHMVSNFLWYLTWMLKCLHTSMNWLIQLTQHMHTHRQQQQQSHCEQLVLHSQHWENFIVHFVWQVFVCQRSTSSGAFLLCRYIFLVIVSHNPLQQQMHAVDRQELFNTYEQTHFVNHVQQQYMDFMQCDTDKRSVLMSVQLNGPPHVDCNGLTQAADAMCDHLCGSKRCIFWAGNVDAVIFVLWKHCASSRN